MMNNKGTRRGGAKVLEVEIPDNTAVMRPLHIDEYRYSQRQVKNPMPRNPYKKSAKATPSIQVQVDNEEPWNSEAIDDYALSQLMDKFESDQDNKSSKRSCQTPTSLNKGEKLVRPALIIEYLTPDQSESFESSTVTQDNAVTQKTKPMDTPKHQKQHVVACTPVRNPYLKPNCKRMSQPMASNNRKQEDVVPSKGTKATKTENTSEEWVLDESNLLNDSALSQLMDRVESEKRDTKSSITSPPRPRRSQRLALDFDLSPDKGNCVTPLGTRDTANEQSLAAPLTMESSHTKTTNAEEPVAQPFHPVINTACTPICNPYLRDKANSATTLRTTSTPIRNPYLQPKANAVTNLASATTPIHNPHQKDGLKPVTQSLAAATPIRNPYLKRKANPVTESLERSRETQGPNGTDDFFGEDSLDDSVLSALMDTVESQQRQDSNRRSDNMQKRVATPSRSTLRPLRIDFGSPVKQERATYPISQPREKQPHQHDEGMCLAVENVLKQRKLLEEYVNVTYLGLRQKHYIAVEPRKNMHDMLCERINFIQLNGDLPDSLIGTMHGLRELGNKVRRGDTNLLPRGILEESVNGYLMEKEAYENRSHFLVN